MKPCAGDWVEVRSKEEILGTLDHNGRLDELPFMPQMFKYCGQRFRVHKSAYKTCDTVSGHYAGRRLPDAVHLDIRCDGQAYGGCQAGCLIFWKNAWLKPVEGPAPAANASKPDGAETPDRSTDRVWQATTYSDAQDRTHYSCQATQLLNYTAPLKWWDARQYVEAYTSGNRTLPELGRGFLFLLYYYGTLAFSDRWGRPARWLYNRFQSITGGVPFPRMKGKIPVGEPMPRRDLGLQPGDLVRVRSYEEILATLDTRLSNRGLWFDAELVPYCGKVFRVSTCVERFVDEKTGEMRQMKTPAVILEGVTCKALYSGRRIFCPRAIHLWWREIWLERVSPDTCPRAPLSIQAGKQTRDELVKKVQEMARPGDMVAVLGVTYRPGTYDTGEATGLFLAQQLKGRGYRVLVHDFAATSANASSLREFELISNWEEFKSNPGVKLAVICCPLPQYRDLAATAGTRVFAPWQS